MVIIKQSISIRQIYLLNSVFPPMSFIDKRSWMFLRKKIAHNQIDALQQHEEQLAQLNLNSATYTSNEKEIILLDISKNLINFLLVQMKQ